jgi:hypothetical protein
MFFVTLAPTEGGIVVPTVIGGTGGVVVPGSVIRGSGGSVIIIEAVRGARRGGSTSKRR